MTMKACQTLVVAACLLYGGGVHAQVARSQFNGTVTDTAGGVLVGATVIATNVETNVESKATTTGAGVYVIPYLPNGLYRIRVTAAGLPAGGRQRRHASRRTDADARLQAGRRCHHRRAHGHGAGHRDEHGGDRPLRLEEGVPDVADRRSATDSGRSSSSSFRACPAPPATRSRDRSTAAATTRTRSSSKASRSAATFRAAATTRCRRRPRPSRSSSCRPARSAPSTAAARRRSPTSWSSRGTNDLHGSGAVLPAGRRASTREPFVAKALEPAHARCGRCRTGPWRMGGPITLPGLYQRTGSQLLLRDVREDARSENRRLDGLPDAADAASSRTATSHACFDPGYTGDARSGTVVGTDALGRPIRFGQIYDPRTTRVVDGAVVARSLPQQPDPTRDVGRGRAQHPRPGPVGYAGARSPAQQPAGAGRPAARCSTRTRLPSKFDQVINTNHKTSVYVNREWRTRNNSLAGRYGPPPGQPTNLYQLQKTPSWMVRASENWVISDRLLHRFAFGYNRFGTTTAASTSTRAGRRGSACTNQPDTTFPRFAFGGTADPRQSGQLRVDTRAGAATKAARSSRTT